MGTRSIASNAHWAWALPALLIGCNAILDNPEGELVVAGGRSSAGGSASIGGSSSTGTHSSAAGNSSLSGGTSGGTGNAAGGSHAGASSTVIGVGGTSALGGTPGTLANSTGGGVNLGGSNAEGGAGPAGGTAAAFGGLTSTSTGGSMPVGGALGSGGALASGGTTMTTTAAATSATGGAATSGGSAAAGGSTTGAPATGGAGTGGVAGETGGGAATGGLAASGGAATGGAATGGALATGGSSSIAGPSVVFSYASVNDAASTNLTTATFQFSSTPAGAAASFQCKLNSAAAFSDCTSGLALSQLAAGGQILTVHAVDSLGHVGPDATRSWTITPLATTIKNIRAGSYDDYLVSVSTGVRVTGFGAESAQQVIFVQEAGPAASLLVDSLTDIAGSPVLNAGMLTRAFTTQAVKAEGTPVTVIGTVTHNDESLELVRASYIWGTGAAVPYNVPEVRTSAVYSAGLEGVRIGLAGEIPAFNCNSGCFNSAIGNNGNLCIETTCIDSGCGTNKILSWLDITDGDSPPVTSGYAIWRGWLVKRSSYYELWTNGSDGYGDDLCM